MQTTQPWSESIDPRIVLLLGQVIVVYGPACPRTAPQWAPTGTRSSRNGQRTRHTGGATKSETPLRPARLASHSGSASMLAYLIPLVALFPAVAKGQEKAKDKDIALTPIGRSETGQFAVGAAEIVAYDPLASARLFVVNGARDRRHPGSVRRAARPGRSNRRHLFGAGRPTASRSARGGRRRHRGGRKTDPGMVAFYDTDGARCSAPSRSARCPTCSPSRPTATTSWSPTRASPTRRLHGRSRRARSAIIDVPRRRRRARRADGPHRRLPRLQRRRRRLDAGVRIFGPGATVVAGSRARVHRRLDRQSRRPG